MLVSLGGCHEKPTPLTPDLKIDFHCARVPSPDVARSYFASQYFTVADTEASRRTKGKHFFPFQVEGYNPRHVVVEVIGLREPPSLGHAINYRLTILSPPPTSHDRGLEYAAKQLVPILGCKVGSIETGENDDASSKQFARFFQVVKERVEEARNDSIQ